MASAKLERLNKKHGVTGKYKGTAKGIVHAVKGGAEQKKSSAPTERKPFSLSQMATLDDAVTLFQQRKYKEQQAEQSDFVKNYIPKNAQMSPDGKSITITSKMTDSERKARIKEINKELTQLSNAESGLKRASMYGNVGDIVERNKARKAELSAELRDLERVGTFKMSDVLQWGIDDAETKKAATSTPPLASNSRMSVEQGREYVKKLSENRGIDEELSKLYAYQAGYKEQEKFDEINKYTTEITSKKDFEQNSKYSPKKPKTEAELKKAGYKKNREGQWYIRSFAGAPEYYQGEDSGNYIYINDKSKREALASESRQQTRGGSFGINSYGKEGYDFLTDAEIGAYNYLYNTKGEKKADEYLEKIRPLLQQRAMEAEAERFAEDAKESPIMMSVFSLGTNLANAAMFPMKAAATLAGEYDDAPTLDRFGNITQAIRGAVSEDMPYLGSLLYNGAMSIGDMGTAMLVGGGNAKAIQAIMSSSAGSSTISEAKKNGASDGKALILGLGSAAIEWATERYSVEAILKDPKTIHGYIASNIITEGTEEGASNIANVALDAIASNILGERNEIEQRIDYLVTYEGKTAEEALKIAFNEKLQSLGEDMLIGGLTGFGVAGTVASPAIVQKGVDTIKNRGKDNTITDTNDPIPNVAQEAESALDPLEQAAREVAARRNNAEAKSFNEVTAQSLERLTQNNAPITSEEVKKVTGFGDRGSELVANNSNADGATFYEVMAEVKPSYTAGFNNPDLDIKKVAHTFNSQAQEDAYTAGQIDGKMLALAQEERAKNAVVNNESGFNADNLPSDVTKGQVETIDLMAKALGVKSYIRKGLKGNAEYNRATGEVPIDFDFEREIGTEGNKQKVSIVFHAAHEMAMHRVVDLAPEEGKAFVYAMYKHLAGNEPSVFTLADEKRYDYAQQGVEISLAEAMEEISANNILYLYNNDEVKFHKAIENIVNGKDAKAKQGLRKYIDYLNNIIRKIREFLSGKSAQERAEIQAELDEITKLRDMFETAFAKAVENRKGIQAKTETNSTKNLENKMNEDYNGNVSHSLKNTTKNNSVFNNDSVLDKSGYIGYVPITKVKMKTFPPYNESKSDANEWATRWAHREEVETGAQTLVFYHNRCYVIGKYDSADLKYQIEGRISYSAYESIRKELEEDARNREKQSKKKMADFLRERNERGNTDEGRGQSVDYSSAEHGREDRILLQLGGEQNGERKLQGNISRSNEYDSKDRQTKSVNEDKNYSLKENNLNKKGNSDRTSEQYTANEYRNFGWARENNILNAGQNADYRSKFADAKVGRAKFAKSKWGEYIIPVSDIYDTTFEGINNVLVFAKGTITNPIITSVIEIYEYDETSLDRVRRRIYDSERRGIQQETGELFRRYNSIDFELRPNQQRTGSESVGHSSNNGLGERSSGEASSVKGETKVNYSLKGTSNTTSDGERKLGLSERLAKYAKDGLIPTEIYNELIEEYGPIQSGENPHRDAQVPRKTEKNKKVSQTVRTILEAKATPDEAVPTIEKMVEDGVFSYEAYTDKKAIENGEEDIKKQGWTQSLTDWFDSVKKGAVSKDIATKGWILYNHAANSGDTEAAITILDAMVKHQRSAAQALQATRILKQLSPETQLYGVQKSVSALQQELTDKYGKKAPDLKINEELAEKFLSAKTEEERIEIEKEIYRDIGRQMPSRFRDKWNAWRYLSMLGNLKTHGRNIIGNAAFAPVVLAKNYTATAIESAVYRVSGKKTLRSKAIIRGNKADKALLKAAYNDYANVADMVSNGGKYSDSAHANQYIEEGRQIFKFKPLEAARKKNSEYLEREDIWFSRPHYAFALAQYCKANNITPEQIKRGMAIAPARAYAIKEAQKATYRDTNVFSQFVSELGRNVVIEGVLPFRKTPANILVRGVEYSPIGLLKGLSYDLVQVSRGKMTSAEAIDNISAGLTGTGLLMLGVYLAAQGLIRGHGEDDEEKKFKELMGHQSYALELLNGKSITLDWLAPEALPFFVGVNIWEATKGKDEELNLSTILQTLTGITEPMLEMSCLQGLNDLFEGIGYARSNDTSPLVAIMASAATSYLMQGIPTLFGQAERTGEENRMTTYTEKNDFLTGDMQYTLGKASAKIPFWDYNQIPYIDAWGRREASGVALKRGFNNFLNPAYTSTIESSDMEKELLRLYEQTGEDGVFPTRADKYFTVDGVRKDLTAEEYVRYATLKGEKSYKAISDLVNSKAYKGLDDREKVKAITEAYDYANQKAKKAISNYKPDKWVNKADEFGSNVGNYLSFRAEESGAKEANAGNLSKTQIADIAINIAQNDSEVWKMYLSTRNNGGSQSDLYAYDRGIKGKTYMNFIESLNEVDRPTESGIYGTYTQEEATRAVRQLEGLSKQEKAVLWQSVNPRWKNNPFR